MDSIKQNGLLLIFMFLSAGMLMGQSISGHVKDQSGMPLLGVNIILEGTSKGAVTDFDGNYTISDVENGTYTLVASSLGYAKFTQSLKVDGDDITVDITMKEDAQSLDQVVNIWFGLLAECLHEG